MSHRERGDNADIIELTISRTVVKGVDRDVSFSLVTSLRVMKSGRPQLGARTGGFFCTSGMYEVILATAYER